jgi:ribA/ribD-fused uncharacterized protein
VIEHFTFFACSTSPFSQWYQHAPFELRGMHFPTAEHYMMFLKAQIFDASESLLTRILAADARGAKALGRQAPGFNEHAWSMVARTVVAEGNYAKFTQNPAALRVLLQTEGTTLVEAAPWDRIWGIGLSADDPRAQHRETWLGRNWLGETLTQVRDTLLSAIRVNDSVQLGPVDCEPPARPVG